MTKPIAVLGASGYTGAEALRILAAHPEFEVVGLYGHRSAGDRLLDHWPQFAGSGLPDRIEAVDVERIAARAEWALLALPHGQSANLGGQLLERGVRVVDLSADFRLDAERYGLHYGDHPCPEYLEEAAYGLPEIAQCRDALVGSRLIAGPGCFPTTVTLAVAPFYSAGLVRPGSVLIADCKTGVTGAGIQATPGTHFCSVADTVTPYKVEAHRHQPEISRNLDWLSPSPTRVRFTPHLVPLRRGILATCYLETDGDPQSLRDCIADFYKESPFVGLLDSGRQPSLARLAGTNRVEIQVVADPDNGLAVVTCGLDNLCKGSAGGAIQALNLALGLDERSGLHRLTAAYP